MNGIIKTALLAGAVAVGATSAMAAPLRHDRDPWVQPVHQDGNAAPAKRFFDQLQRDGE